MRKGRKAESGAEKETLRDSREASSLSGEIGRKGSTGGLDGHEDGETSPSPRHLV
jgi:hypothetical protein